MSEYDSAGCLLHYTHTHTHCVSCPVHLKEVDWQQGVSSGGLVLFVMLFSFPRCESEVSW